MKQPEKSGDISSEAPDSKQQKRIQRLDQGVRYYASKMHVAFTIMGIVFGIVEVSYGATYNGQCPIQQMIGIFLIVHGSVMLLEAAVGIFAIIVARVIYIHNQKLARRLVFVIFLFIIVVNLFCFAWFIAGSVWIFGAFNNGYQYNDSSNPNTYCEYNLFRAAFGTVISRYILVGVFIIVLLIKKRRTIIGLCKKEEAPGVNGTDSAQM